ncbi:MAG TPA: OmpA family protein [Longimicrobium sp.]|nr:OmpA family protein [Longimicrobium sp.]
MTETLHDEGWEESPQAGPWPAFVDLFAATSLVLLVFFAVLATRYLRLEADDRVVRTQVDSLYSTLQGMARDTGRFTVSRQGLDVLIVLEENVSFPRSHASLSEMKEEGRNRLRTIGGLVHGPMFKDLIHEVEVIGHADSTQYHARRGESPARTNWELSSARAAAVAQFLVDSLGFDPCQIISSGRGEYYPRDRSTPGAAAAPGEDPLAPDRRVEILLHSRIGDTSQMRPGCRARPRPAP